MEKQYQQKLSEYNFLAFAITVFRFQMYILRMKAFFQRYNCQTPVVSNQNCSFEFRMTPCCFGKGTVTFHCGQKALGGVACPQETLQ